MTPNQAGSALTQRQEGSSRARWGQGGLGAAPTPRQSKESLRRARMPSTHRQWPSPSESTLSDMITGQPSGSKYGPYLAGLVL